MKNFISIAVISVLLISLSCSTPKVKPKPSSEHNWYICTLCKGLGTVVTLSAKSSADDVTKNPGEEYACCFFSLGILTFFNNDRLTEEKSSNQYNRRDDNLNPDKNFEAMKQRIPERSIVKKRTKCHLCDGSGWISDDIYNSSPVIIKNKNELLLKDIIID
jgi:hypothetical protein